MRDVVRTVGAVRLALSTRRDFLLESLALRHQLGILARSNRRFRAADRLLWLLLRRLWPLPLGRSKDRHGELLKLGIVVSERTVSRYLRGHPPARSQTWRTFFANHLGDLAFNSPVTSSMPNDDDVVDASGLSFCPVPLSLDGLCSANQRTVVEWPGSRRHPSLGWRLDQDHVQDRTGARTRTGDPPRHLRLQLPSRRTGKCFVHAHAGLCDRQRRETTRLDVASSQSQV